jgi:hypothetical protein
MKSITDSFVALDQNLDGPPWGVVFAARRFIRKVQSD